MATAPESCCSTVLTLKQTQISKKHVNNIDVKVQALGINLRNKLKHNALILKNKILEMFDKNK